MQKPARQKTTHGGRTPGCRYYKTLQSVTDWAVSCSMPSIKQAHVTPLSFYHLLEYNHHGTFLCDYYSNSNLGKISINQTDVCALSEMTKTICAKKGCSYVPQKQLSYLKYKCWTKTTY